MIAALSTIGIILAASSVLAEIVPTTPTEDQIFHSGDVCTMSWNPDTASDGWKTMRIDLVTGSQSDLTLVTEVADAVDSTSSGPGSYSWTCPTVDFDGPVYSYMFTPSDGPDPPVYSSQFTITSFDGNVDVPGSNTASGAIPDPSDVVADPSGGQAHIGNPVPNASLGEEMLPNIDVELGGPDSAPAIDTDNRPNFLADALAAGQQATNANAASLPVASSRQFQGMQAEPSTAHATQAAAGTQAAGVSTSTHVMTVPSGPASASAATASISHISASIGASLRQIESSGAALRLALLAFCVGQFLL